MTVVPQEYSHIVVRGAVLQDCIVMQGELVERIYEAAFQPECWQQVLLDVGALVDSPAGVMFVFDDLRPVQHKATPVVAEVAHASIERWRESPRMAYVQKRPFFGFAVLNDYFPAELMAHDPCRRELEAAGLDSETAAAVPLPTGELVIYGFTKLRWEAQHTEADTIRLNTLLPHSRGRALWPPGSGWSARKRRQRHCKPSGSRRPF